MKPKLHQHVLLNISTKLLFFITVEAVMVMSAAATSESNSVADFVNSHNEISEDKSETDVPFNNNNNNNSAKILNDDDDDSQSDCDTRSPSNLVINYVDFSEAESEGGEEENRRKNICRNIEYLDTQYKGKLNTMGSLYRVKGKASPAREAIIIMP